jgi:opacity protein-like surface antigen
VTDIKGSNGVSDSIVVPGIGSGSGSITLSENVKYLGSARARLGWLPASNVLLYGTAGLAWERLDRTRDLLEVAQLTGQPTQSFIFSSRSPDDKFGWVAGVGAEVMLGSPNWIGRVEYLHYDLGQVAVASTSTRAIPPTTEIATAGSQTIDLVRAGLSYKFGEPSNVASVPYANAPIVAPPSSWAGFYLGAHGGYGWGDSPSSLPLALVGGTGTVDGTKPKGWLAGGHFGYNWQYNRFVTGLEIDLSAADIKGNSNATAFEIPFPVTGTGTAVIDEKVKYLGTVRGRLGWLPTDSVLLYGTAGLAWERFEHGQTVSQTTAEGTETDRIVTPSDRFGWVAGVGGEVMLGSSNWIGRLEYLHYDFGRINDTGSVIISAPGQNISAILTAGHQTIDVVRAGASYKFGPAGAAVAAPAMYAKAPRMLPLQTWAGFYFGAHAGYGWKDNDFSTNFFNGGSIGGISSRGWLGGGQAGYNWQYARVVAGLELDGSATGIKGSSQTVTSGTLTETLSDNVKYLGTARGRLGWTPAGNWLLYGTGGLAWERVHRSPLMSRLILGSPANQPMIDRAIISAGRRAPVSKPSSAARTGSRASNICTTISAPSNPPLSSHRTCRGSRHLLTGAAARPLKPSAPAYPTSSRRSEARIRFDTDAFNGRVARPGRFSLQGPAANAGPASAGRVGRNAVCVINALHSFRDACPDSWRARRTPSASAPDVRIRAAAPCWDRPTARDRDRDGFR